MPNTMHLSLATCFLLFIALPDCTGEEPLAGAPSETTGSAVTTPGTAAGQRSAGTAPTTRARLRQAEAPLQVTSSTPSDASRAVPVDVQPTIRLNRPVLPGAADALTLMGPLGAVNAHVTYLEDGGLVVVRPDQALLPATVYTLYVKGLKDHAGQTLPLTTIGYTTASLTAGQGSRDARLPRPQPGRPAARAEPVASLLVAEKKGAEGRHAWRAPEQPLLKDGEAWLPAPENLRGSWRSHEPKVNPVELLRAPEGVTALSGRVLRLNGKPLAGVRVVVRSVATETDAEGRFLLAGLNAGGQTLEVNGQTANRGATRYGLFFMRVDVQAGRTNELGHTVWMPRLDPQGTVALPSPTTEEVAVTTPAIPGLELRLPPGTVVRDRAGNILTEINITPIPVNQAPFPLPNLEMPLYFTLQPGDARFEGLTPGFSGARLYYANYRGELPGAKANFWTYDANGSGWSAYGLGSVSADGRQVIPDDGVALYGFVGAGLSNPDAQPPPVGGPCNFCCSLHGDGDSGCDGTAGAAGSPTGGDPVMLASGQFLSTDVDLVIEDIIPIQLRRTYRSLDMNRRQFGVGMTSNYERFLWRPTSGFSQYELVNPDGTRVHYDRVSPGTGYIDAVFETGHPGPWAGSRITYNTRISGWDLTLRDGQRWTFNHAHRLSEMVDRHGNTLLINRQSGTSGPIIRIDGPSARWVEFTIVNGLTTQAKDSGNRVVNYTYDALGRLTQVTDAAGGARKYTYNASNYLETIVDEENRLVVQNEYGPKGRLSKQTLADGSTFELTYTLGAVVQCFPNGGCNVRDGEQIVRTDVQDRTGQVRRVSFSSGYIVRDVYPLGRPDERVTSFNLAPSNGRLDAMIDDRGQRSEYEYDARGNVAKITRLAGTPEAVAMEYTYTADSKVASVKDALGHLIRYYYDAAGNLARREDATGRSVTYTHDSQGRVLTLRPGTEVPLIYDYEGGDLIAMTDAAGQRSELVRDALGRMVARRSPGGHVDRYEYDARDRLTRHINPLGHSTVFTYDKSGKITSTKDPRGKETTYRYNVLGLLVERVDPLGRAEVYDYDVAGRPKSFQDRKGQVSGWGYDSMGQMVMQGFGATPTSPEGYANRIGYVYDESGRLVRMEDSLGPVINLTYDELDRLVQEVSPNGTVSYTYDAAGRLTTLAAIGQAQIAYAYDHANRLISITQGDHTVSFTYDAAGRRASTALPGGVTQKYTYDAAGRLARIDYVKGMTSLGDLTYNYDVDGNPIASGGTFARTRLPDAVAGAAYDAASQLITWKGRTLTYDANGNVTSDGLKTYTWDTRNQLIQMSNGSGMFAQFAYEPTGRRSRRTVEGVILDYLYSGSNFIQARSNAGTTSLLTGFGMDEVYSQSTSTGSRDFLSDVLGSTVALTDETGALAAEYGYEPYGVSEHTGDAAGNTQTFTGREDDGTGLYYYRARYYDPDMGRFLQSEPLLQRPEHILVSATQGHSVSAYSYALNSPLHFTDRDGMQPRPGCTDACCIPENANACYEPEPDACYDHSTPATPDELPRPEPGTLPYILLRYHCDDARDLCLKGGNPPVLCSITYAFCKIPPPDMPQY